MAILTRDRGFYRSFFSLTGMIAFQNILAFSVNLADNLMLGAYSEISMSGVALVNQIQFLLQMLVMGVGEGIVVLASQYWGRKDTAPIRRIVSIGLWFGLASAMLLFAAVFFFPQGCLGLLTDETAVIGEGVRYLRIICFTYPLFAVTNVLLCSLRSVETVKIGFVVSASTLVINSCLNYVLIYGHFGAPEMGVQGAAVATLISRAVECVIAVVYVARLDRKIRYRFREIFRIDRSLLRDYLRTGLPVILSNAMWGIAQAVQTSILGHLGQAPIAANSIASTVFQILSVIVYGAASASSIIMGKTIGEGRLNQARQYAKTLQILYLIIGIATGTALFLLKDVILGFYEISPETRALAVQFLTVLSVTVVGTAYQVAVLTGIVRGGGDTRFVLYNDTIFMWLVVIPSAALAAFVFHLPPLIVFICLKCDQVLKCLVAAVKVNRGNWIRQLTHPQKKGEEPDERAVYSAEMGG